MEEHRFSRADRCRGTNVVTVLLLGLLLAVPRLSAVSPADPVSVRIAAGTKACDEADKLLAEGKVAEALKLYQEVLTYLPTSPRAKAGVVACKASPEVAGTAAPESATAAPELVPQVGHSGEARALAWSPDGSILATGGHDHSICLWDAVSGEQRRLLSGHTGEVTGLAFGPDGRWLVSVAEDPAAMQQAPVIVWEVATGRPLRKLAAPPSGGLCVAWSPDGRTAAVPGGPGKIQLWDAVHGKLVRGLTAAKQGQSYLSAVAFSPDGRLLATGFTSAYPRPSRVAFWDVAGGTELWGVDGPARQVMLVAFCPTDRTVAIAPGTDMVNVWSLDERRTTRTLSVTRRPELLFQADPGSIKALAFAPDGQTLAVASGLPPTVTVWGTATGEVRASLTEQFAPRVESSFRAHGLAFGPGGQTLALLRDGGLVLWDVANQRVRATLRNRLDCVRQVSASNDGRIVAATSRQDNDYVHGSVTVWDGTTGVARCVLGAAAVGCAVSPDGSTVATPGGEVGLWDTATGERRSQLQTGATGIVRYSPTGDLLATTAGIWDVVTGTQRRAFGGGWPWAFSRDGEVLVTGGNRSPFSLWRLGTGARQATLGNTEAGLSDLGVALSPDGRFAITGGPFNRVAFWNAVSGTLLHSASLHASWVRDVAWSPDSNLAASAGEAATIVIWDGPRGTPLRALRDHTAGVLGLCFLPGGRLVSASRDGTLRFWDASAGRLLATCYSLDAGRDWLVTTPAGYYAASPSALSAIRWRVGDRLYPAEEFQARYHKPELVAKAVRGEALP